MKRGAKIISSAPLTQQVEYLHGKQKVAGSNPAEGSHSSPQRRKEFLETERGRFSVREATLPDPVDGLGISPCHASGKARHGKAWHGKALPRPGKAWQGLARHGQAWPGMARHGQSEASPRARASRQASLGEQDGLRWKRVTFDGRWKGVGSV